MKGPETGGLTLAEFARAKQLDIAGLREYGLCDSTFAGQRAVKFPYGGVDGYECAVHYRLSMDGAGFRWEPGTQICLYGLWRLKRMRTEGYIALVEGESDALTLWLQGFPALGLPGAASWREDWALHLAGFATIFVVIEPDKGGRTVMKRFTKSSIRDRVRFVSFDGSKDPSELYLKDRVGFLVAFRRALKLARPWAKEDEHQATGRISQSSQLIALADEVNLFHSDDGKPFATIRVNDHAEHWSLKSSAFKQWMSKKFFDNRGTVASSQALHDALNVLIGKALYEGKPRPVFRRVADHEGRIYVDLADPAWKAVEITSSGWRIVTDPPVLFRRASGMLEIPEPVPGGEISEIKSFLSVQRNDNLLILAWLIAALKPQGPYPILCFHGEQGSGKSTKAKIVRSLVDPNVANLRAPPRDVRDLMIAATNSHVVAFDNLSHLDPWLSDGLCRLATGGGFATRELYTDEDEIIFNAMRPVLLNGIGEVTSRSDLMERSLPIYLPLIPKTERQTERKLWARFEKARPRIFGALLTAFSSALRAIGSITLHELPRMADFAELSTAAERALGFKSGAFMRLYSRNLEEANAVVLESSPVAEGVKKLLESRDGLPWQGTASELLEELTEPRLGRDQLRGAWPKSPNGLSVTLRRLAPNLRATGIFIRFHRQPGTGQRLIEIRPKL